MHVQHWVHPIHAPLMDGPYWLWLVYSMTTLYSNTLMIHGLVITLTLLAHPPHTHASLAVYGDQYASVLVLVRPLYCYTHRVGTVAGLCHCPHAVYDRWVPIKYAIMTVHHVLVQSLVRS